MLKPHQSAALEYWYFKIHEGTVALIVDWIEDRKNKTHVLRASVHAPDTRKVLFHHLAELMPDGNYLKTDKTQGQIEDISWDLDINIGPDIIKPDLFPAGLLRLSDMQVINAPQATFTGRISVGHQQFNIQDVTGLVSHYWGRKLAYDWWWISAHQFQNAHIVVDCAVATSRSWGMRPHFSFAYLYLYFNEKPQFVIAPFNLARVTGTPERFVVAIRRIGKKPITLICTGRDYAAFDKRIINTLVGDLEVRIGDQVIGIANGTAGLERLYQFGSSQYR